MTDETPPQLVEADASLRAELIAKGEKIKAENPDFKFDKRWNTARMEEALAAHAMDDVQGEPRPQVTPAAEGDDAPAAEPGVAAMLAEIDRKHAEQMAALEAKLAAMSAAPLAAPAASTPTAAPAFVVAAPPPAAPPAPAPNTVACRVTKAGDGKIFTGLADPTHFKWNDIVHIPEETAKLLETRNFVEIGSPNG